ncbi:MAG: outer membrane beta-barrel family protein, partial [Bacteroidota bacterium]
KPGHELTADVTWNRGSNENTANINTAFFALPSRSFIKDSTQLQLGSGENKNLILQTDYTKPLSENSKIEFGARASIREVSSRNQFYKKNVENSLYFPSGNNVLYNSSDKVYAAYTTFSNRIKNFGYQLGLRVESSDYSGDLLTTKQTFNIKFPFSFFPSVFISQKISENDELQFNYSRRVNRPNFFQLLPFIDSCDLLNVSVGNPGLNPEFTNSLEASYSKLFQNRDNLLFSAYFKNTTDLITRFQTIDPTISKEGIVNTYINANRSFVTGLEVTARNKISKWWDMTSNINLFTGRIDVDGQPRADMFPSYFIKLNNSFKLPKNFTFQLSGEYQSKIVSSPGGGGRGGGGGGPFGGGGGMFGGGNTASQGFIRPNYGVDAALRFEFLKNKVAALSLNVNDIFRTRLYDAFSQSSFFEQNIQRRRDPQVFRLNFSFRFGKFDANLFKRRNTKAEGNVETGGGNL